MCSCHIFDSIYTIWLSNAIDDISIHILYPFPFKMCMHFTTLALVTESEDIMVIFCIFIFTNRACEKADANNKWILLTSWKSYLVYLFLLHYRRGVAGSAGWLVIGRSLVQIPALRGWAELHFDKQDIWTLNCSWCAVGTLNQWRALRWAGDLIKAVTDTGWMDLPYRSPFVSNI